MCLRPRKDRPLVRPPHQVHGEKKYLYRGHQGQGFCESDVRQQSRKRKAYGRKADDHDVSADIGSVAVRKSCEYHEGDPEEHQPYAVPDHYIRHLGPVGCHQDFEDLRQYGRYRQDGDSEYIMFQTCPVGHPLGTFYQ